MNFPMVYTTAYRWTGTGDVGEEQVAGNEPIRVSGPMVSGNFDPEHLFVATAEVCLANTFFFFASNSRLDVAAYRSSTEGTLEKAPEGGFRFKEVVIRPVISVEQQAMERAEPLLEKAHRFCLVARSLCCPVLVEPTFLPT